jgi:hypothetical protein
MSMVLLCELTKVTQLYAGQSLEWVLEKVLSSQDVVIPSGSGATSFRAEFLLALSGQQNPKWSAGKSATNKKPKKAPETKPKFSEDLSGEENPWGAPPLPTSGARHLLLPPMKRPAVANNERARRSGNERARRSGRSKDARSQDARMACLESDVKRLTAAVTTLQVSMSKVERRVQQGRAA